MSAQLDDLTILGVSVPWRLGVTRFVRGGGKPTLRTEHSLETEWRLRFANPSLSRQARSYRSLLRLPLPACRSLQLV